MLMSVDGKLIKSIPHKEEYEIWKGRLTENQFNAVVEYVNTIIDTNDVQTSSWMPPKVWADTALEPIYTVACRENEINSGLFFGLIVWKVMMDRNEYWSFGRYESKGIPIKGITYFRVTPNERH